MRQLVLSFMMALMAMSVHSQTCEIEFAGDKKDIAQFKLAMSKKVNSCDSLAVTTSLTNALSQLHIKGYLNADFTIKNRTDSSVALFVFAGNPYSWNSLKLNNLKSFNHQIVEGDNFNHNQLSKLFSEYLTLKENSGYPFAHIGLDSVILSDEKLSAVVRHASGPFITFDTLKIEGTKSVKRDWLATYLKISYGSPFDQKQINRIEKKLDMLSFIEQEGYASITFQNNEAKVTLPLKDKRVNRINGLIGFLPNEQNGELLVTGELELGLRNLFRSGKSLDVKWQSLKARSQFLNMKYYHPNLLHSDMNLAMGFKLLKEDTLFATRSMDINLVYSPANFSLAFFADFKSSGLLSTAQFEGLQELPETVDFKVDNYGLEYSYTNVTSRLRRKGIELAMRTSVGLKRINRNQGIQPVLYEGVDLKTSQYDLMAQLKHFFPLNKSFSIYYSLSAAKLINDRLFINDLYRLGGLKSLRGFNENFFFAGEYALSNVEARFYFQPESFFSFFYDQAYIYYDIQTSTQKDYPLGIGAGLNLSTTSGILTLAYALGKSNEQDLSFALSKFHFGYIAKF